MTERRYAAFARVPPSLAALLGATLVLVLSWSLVTPLFQAPDEQTHFAYIQSLAESGDLPGDPARPMQSTEQGVSGDSGADQAAGQLVARMEWSERVYERWQHDTAAIGPEQRGDGGGPNPAGANPPLYYLLAAGAYHIAGGDLLDRLFAVRLMSGLWLLVTVVGVWLLIGELTARDRLAQLAGAAFAGMLPMVGFISASATPDGMLYAAWSLALWLGVRILKRGITVRSALAFAAVVGLACVVKATSYALLPGAALVLCLGAWRARAPAALAAGAAALAMTAGTWLAIAGELNRPASAQLSAAASTGGLEARELISYAWQYYLPRTPFQDDLVPFAHTLPLYDVLIKMGWAAFGWQEIRFGEPVYWVLAAVTALLAVLAATTLWRDRRRVDLAVCGFLLLVAGTLLAGLHWTEYRQLNAGQGPFIQGRYLFPLIGLGGLVVAGALRAVPPRLRAASVAAFISALFVLDIFSLERVMERFYA
jgi:4-amino-4-deoxy-L-arabinose transferase-like glycosyltransferase